MRAYLHGVGYKKAAQALLCILAVFGIGFFVGQTSNRSDAVSNSGVYKIRSTETKFKLIKPLLAVDTALPRESPEYKKLKEQVNAYIESATREGKVDKVSVYFRDIEHIVSVGINENESYDPASLLKVPIMMAYLKKAETNPAILDVKVQYAADPNNPVLSTSTIKPGVYYTVDELIRLMIVDSDNVAKNLLLDANLIGPNGLRDVFADLDISAPSDYVKEYFISAKSYSLFFRVLYNATYLNREMSEKALQLLTKVTFNEGIMAGVPKTLTVANKFGQYGIYADGSLTGMQLHDCGIVYYPNNAYLLCVMTRGRDFNSLTKVIRTISKMTYDIVHAKYPAAI